MSSAIPFFLSKFCLTLVIEANPNYSCAHTLLGQSELSSFRRISRVLLPVSVMLLLSAFMFWSATNAQLIKAEPTTPTVNIA
jgi:hypothetical protein